MSSLRHFLGPAALMLWVAACGGSPVLIDRTQPNYIKKSELLSGTWYIQETIVDVPPTAAITAVGFGSGLEKVRFEIQEDNLVAYRTYEYLPGSDPLVDQEKSRIGHTVYKDGRPYRGAPVAAWPIASHFDRQREYNAATGEQTNVLEENESDRPWYEREFIRVDWSRNVLTNFFSYTSNLAAPVQLYVTPIDQNPGEHALVTEYKETNGKKELTYFDFTIRALLDPPSIYYPGYGAIPYCWLNPRIDCASAEVKIRTSVRKVDEEHVEDYEPLMYSDRLESKFGFFRTERYSYDRNRGVTEAGRMLYANRHNIWERAHDSDGNVIPVEKRQPKPIVYYLTPNFPKDLLPAAKQIEKSWDDAFRRAVAVPRGIKVEEAPQMFYVCETPVPEDAPAACGERGLVVRLGDLRYNMIPWIDQPQLRGPLGLGPSAADPETGEIIQGVANIYGAALDTWVGEAQTIIDVLNGDLSISDLISAKNVKDYVFSHLNPTDPRRPVSGPWTSQQPLVSDPQRPAASFTAVQGRLRTVIEAARAEGHLPYMKQDRRKVVDELISQNPALESELINNPEVRALVFANAPGETFRQKLQTDPSFYRQVARQTMLGIDSLEQLNRDRIEWASQMKGHGCVFLAEFADDAMYGLAKEMAKLYQTRFAELQASGNARCANQSACTPEEAKSLARDEVYTQLRIAAFRSVTEHEIGHTVGLMHNFIGSFDALNFMDGYWDLRKQTVGVQVAGKRVMPLSPANLADAAKMNQAQLDGRMREYQYSSIMDYGSRMNADVHGIGKYDKAAILFTYSGGAEPGYVEVFNETRGHSPADYSQPNTVLPTDNAAKEMVVRGAHVEIPLALVQHFTPVDRMITDKFHYTTLPFMFAEKQLTFDEALEQGIERMNNRSFRKWSELEPLYKQLEADIQSWSLSQGGFSVVSYDEAGKILSQYAVGMPVEVPYMFCSDYEVGANVACNRWDTGADMYEMSRDWIDRYQQYYVFTNFQRDRMGFSPNSVFSRIYGRLLGNLPNVYQQWLFVIYWIQDYYNLTTEQMEQYVNNMDPVFQNYWTMAVIDGVNALMQPLSTPSAGYHGKLASGNWVHLSENNPHNGRIMDAQAEAQFIQRIKDKYTDPVAGPQIVDVVYVPRGPGRSMYTVFETDGYDAFTRVSEVGHFWDQIAGLNALTQSESLLIGVDRGGDSLRYTLPYYMVFNKELASLFQGVWAEDRARYAAALVKTGNGEATVIPPVFVRGEDFITGFAYPPPPVAPVDSGGSPLPMEKVEASPTWGTRFYAEVWGMAYFTEAFDQEFASFNQVFRLGSGETIDPAPGFTVEQFPDPFGGGYIYAALRKTTEPQPAAAPQLIMNGNDYVAKWQQAKSSGQPVDGLTAGQWEGKVREVIRSLEIMRGLYGIFGTTW